MPLPDITNNSYNCQREPNLDCQVKFQRHTVVPQTLITWTRNMSFFMHYLRLASGYARQHIPSWSRPRNRDGCGRNSIWHKNTLGCMAELTPSSVCLLQASQWSYSERRKRGPAINQGLKTNPELGKYKGCVWSFPRVLHVSFNYVHQFLCSITP